MTEKTPKPFGFTVEYCKARNINSDNASPAGWNVYLPHMCDAWMITGDWRRPVPREEAIEALGRFITEALAALGALTNGQEYGDA